MLTLAATNTAQAQKHVTRIPHRCTSRSAPRLCAIHWHHKRVNVIRHKMNLRTLKYHWRAEGHPALRGRLLTYWVKRHKHALKRLSHYHPPVSHVALSAPWSTAWYNGAICVHEHEGAWNSNTGNGYYGGFQYLTSTWLASGGGQYASRADLATPYEQLLVTYHVTSRSGWGQWPNTARMCGLL